MSNFNLPYHYSNFNFLKSLLGVCNYAGDEIHARDPKRLHPAFLKLAESTSGLAIVFQTRKELEQMSNWKTGMMEGDTIVFIGSTLPDRSKRSLADESANRQYRIPVDDSIEKMSLTIYTVGEGTTVSDAYVPSNTLEILRITFTAKANVRFKMTIFQNRR